jgi:phage portal protein BeeE
MDEENKPKSGLLRKTLNYVEASLDARIKSLEVQPVTSNDLFKGEKQDGTVGRKGLIFDPFIDQSSQQGLYKMRTSFLSNAMLKQVARRDSIISAILDLRANQIASFCKRPANRFEEGFKFVPKDKNTSVDADEVRKAEEFILNTGYTEDRTPADKMTFDQWGAMVTKDMLRYGHAAIEKVKRNDGDLFSFLPLASESIFYANKKATPELMTHFREIWQNMSNVTEQNKEAKKDPSSEEYEYVQVINGQVVEGFTHEELIFARHNLESDLDTNSYCISQLEKCVGAVTSHLQVENHQKQFFNHGTASKGLLWIAGDVAPNTLRALQAQWNNQITGPTNAWRTPILAGVQNVQWVPLTASNRDMEFAAWQDYVLRLIFASFQIDPEEVGFGYLSKGTEQRSMGESSNEWKITASRDRGLRPILGRIEAIINEEVLPAFSKSFSEKYHFQFVGIDAETETEETQRLQVETSLHTSMDEAREQADKDKLKYGGSLILNPLLLQYLQANLPKGVFMETFLGVEGASQRPDLAYIPDPMWFQYQQMQMQMMQGIQGGGQPGQDPNGGGDPSQQGQPQQDGQDGQPQKDADAQAQADAQQAQMEAVQQYMEANPELFKSLKSNLSKYDDLKKAETAKQQVTTEHVEIMTEQLMKDYNRGAEKLIKEILKEVKAEIKDKLD